MASFGGAVLAAWLALGAAPYDVMVPTTLDQSPPEDFKQAIEKLQEPEKKLVGLYLMRTMVQQKFTGVAPKQGVTIGQAIKLQRALMEQQNKEEAQSKLLAAKAKTSVEATRKAIRDAVTVSLVSFQYAPTEFSGTFSVTMLLENKTKKEIAGVKGEFELRDMFGTLIKNVRYSFDDGLQPEETKSDDRHMDFNQFMDNDKKLATQTLEKLKVTWVPEMLIFADGTTLGRNSER